MLWKIIYRDGSAYSDKDGPAFEAPATGVQVILQHSGSVGRNILANHDYYWFEDRWFGGDLAGLILYLIEHKGAQKVILGKFVVDDVFHAAMKQAVEDPDFLPKSARNTEDR
jgi:hypothetical protein